MLTHVLRFFGGFQLVASSHDMEKYRRSVNQFTAILVISGMLWGLTGFMAARWGNNLHHLLILAVVTGLVGGSISTISPIFKAFMGFIIPATVLQSLSFYFSNNVAVMGREPFYEVFISLLILLYMIVIYQAGMTLQKSRVDTLDLQNALQTSKERAEWASNAKSRFLSSVSHELRTPLNAIMGFAQLLELDETLDRKQHEQAEQIMHASEHLLALISQVLELSRIEAGDMQIHAVDFELSALSQECLELVAAAAEKNQVVIHNKLPVCHLYTDKLKFKQILLNLITNAIKYNHKGGEVILDCKKMENDILCLSVSDTGHGIPVHRQEELFQAFNRLGRETDGVEGVGIGLVISKELAQALGGVISFHSEEGQGSVFRVEIPVRYIPHTAEPLTA